MRGRGGERARLAAPRFLAALPVGRAPRLFRLRSSDRLLTAVAWAGLVLAAAVVAGVPQAGPAWAPMLAWFALWALYLSIVNVGQTFYAFGWGSLLPAAGAPALFPRPARH